MLSRIAAWSSKRNAEREESEFEDIVEELSGIPNLKLRRKWSERKLHDELAADRISKADRTILVSELRRREAWAAPAGKAFWILIAALGLSIASLAITFFRG